MAQLEVGGQPFSATSETQSAEDLTSAVQRNLLILGYEISSISGEMDVETAIAISKFEAANNMDVSGEVSQPLANALEASVAAMRNGESAPAAAAQASLSADAQAEPEDPNCLRETTDDAVDSSLSAGRLARAGGRLFSRFGGDRAAQELNEAAATATDVAVVASTVGDFSNCDPNN